MTEPTESGFDINEVMKYLPHRYPFLLIDRVIDYKQGEYLKAIKNVTMNEPFFVGHFPTRPVMPGVMILEAVAQASALFAAREAGEEVPENRIYLFAGADDVRFKRPVEPGDQLVFDVRIKRRVRNIWVCVGEVSVEDKVVCTANLKFTYRDT